MHFVTVFTPGDWLAILILTLLALTALYFWVRSKVRKARTRVTSWFKRG